MSQQKKALSRTVQCAKCPWKKTTDPYTIPGEYSLERHQKLCSTISPGLPADTSILKVMACHHSLPGQEEFCIGYLYNQLGEGNNVGLRMHMRGYQNVKDITIDGEQHTCFQDTLPAK